MKKMKLHPILVIMLLMLCFTTVIAQDDYVVTINGDTLRGKVKYFSNSTVKYTSSGASRYIQLTPPEGKKTMHQVMQTISFKMSGDTYHTIRLEQGGYTFMRLISQGYLSLYAYQLDNQTTWDGRYFAKRDGKVMDVPNIGFKKRVGSFLSDCTEVVSKIEGGDLNRSNLPVIVTEYNACVNARNTLSVKKASVSTEWVNLESAVKALPDFEKKTDALEMIREVQSKISKNETVPSFLTNGIKDALKDQTTIQETLDKAIEKVK